MATRSLGCDQMSLDTLDTLPLPFIITFSSRTRRYFQECVKVAKFMETVLGPEAIVLRLDLDFRDGVLWRIVLYRHHPITGFYTKPSYRKRMGFQIDADLNLFLWLLKKNPNRILFHQAYMSQSPPRLKQSQMASLSEMWNALQKECNENRIL